MYHTPMTYLSAVVTNNNNNNAIVSNNNLNNVNNVNVSNNNFNNDFPSLKNVNVNSNQNQNNNQNNINPITNVNTGNNTFNNNNLTMAITPVNTYINMGFNIKMHILDVLYNAFPPHNTNLYNELYSRKYMIHNFERLIAFLSVYYPIGSIELTIIQMFQYYVTMRKFATNIEMSDFIKQRVGQWGELPLSVVLNLLYVIEQQENDQLNF
jgi:hypothetical protein